MSPDRTHRYELGLTLVEVMVAMTIGLALTIAVSNVYLSTSQTRNDLERVSQTTDNARFAVDLLTEDLRHAGFYGPFVPTNNAVYNDALPCEGNMNNLGWNLVVTPQQLPAAVQGLDDPAALPAGWTCLPDALPGADVVTLRRVVETPVMPATLTTNNVPYVQASQCADDEKQIQYSGSKGDFTLRNLKCEAGVEVPVRQYITRTYYVARCNVCDPSDGVPTLKRVEMRDGAFTVQALAEGVVAMQLQYGFDTNNDGNIDLYQTHSDAVNPWSNVIAVRASMLMESTGRVSGAADTRTYNLGPGHTNEVCPEGRRCVLTTNTVRLINVAGRREVP